MAAFPLIGKPPARSLSQPENLGAEALARKRLLGGSWAVISRDMSRVTILITHIRGLITLLTATHETSKQPFQLWSDYINLKRLKVKPTQGPNA